MVHDDTAVGLDGLRIEFDDERSSQTRVRCWSRYGEIPMAAVTPQRTLDLGDPPALLGALRALLAGTRTASSACSRQPHSNDSLISCSRQS